MPVSLTPEQRDLLALTLVPGLGPRLTAAALEHFGSASAVRQATEADFQEIPHIGKKLARDFTAALQRVDVVAEIARMEEFGVTALTLGTPPYPDYLAQIPDPPQLIYLRGTLAETDHMAIAIVGSRHCTNYGRRITTKIASGLARAGFTVVSGLARGIDGSAHQAALDAGGRTIAVLAGGLSSIYPPEHVELSQRVEQSGCLVTETPILMEPLAGMFHARNRIISGLARAVVVIEANDRSGALITARHAAQQGREVFAVPSEADNPAGAGTLQLLRDGARLIRHADDLLEDLKGIPLPTTPASPRAKPSQTEESPQPTADTTAPVPTGLDAVQMKVWEFLTESRAVDEITRELGIPVVDLTRVLMQLEMKKAIRRLPGNRYERR